MFWYRVRQNENGKSLRCVCVFVCLFFFFGGGGVFLKNLFWKVLCKRFVIQQKALHHFNLILCGFLFWNENMSGRHLVQKRKKLVMKNIPQNHVLVLFSKLLASLMRNYFPQRASGAPFHTLSKLYDAPVCFVSLPLLSQCIAIFTVAESCLLLNIGWFVLFVWKIRLQLNDFYRRFRAFALKVKGI